MSNRFVIANPDRCIGCYTCMAACSVKHQQEGLQNQPRLTLTYASLGTMPVQCRHCEDAPCAMICPVKAIEIRDGMVFLNEGLCIGCKMCAIVCPFGAIQMSGTMPPSIEPPASDISPYLRWFPGLKTIAVKCDLCQFSESGPECVRICPTKALKLVEGDEIERLSKLKRSISAAGAISIFREAEE